jgi:trigger factor
MKITTERIENCQVRIVVELDAAETADKIRKTAHHISSQFTVPGYRRGKAPVAAVIRTFGREAFRQEALEGFGQELYEKAVKESGYEPYRPGDLKDVEWDPFRMTVLLPLKPELDLGDYRSVRVSPDPEPVEEQQIEAYLAELQSEHSQWVPVEHPAASGCQVVIDASGKAGELTVLDLTGRELVLDAEAAVPLPGFQEQIVGMSAGEEKTFTLTYPQDHEPPEHAGLEAAFTVKVHSVKEKDVPAIDDELAVMVGDYASLEGLKASIRQDLEADAREKAESGYLDKVLEAIIQGAVKVEYPPLFVDDESDISLNQMERNLASAGLKLDEYLKAIGKTREAYKRDLRPAADERAGKRLVLVEIARREGLKAEEDQVDAELARLTEALQENEEMLKFLASPEGRISVADDLVLAKAQERVIQIGKGEAPALELAAPPETVAEAEAEPAAEAEHEAAAETGAEATPEADVEDKAQEDATLSAREEQTAAEPEAGGESSAQAG